MMPLKASPNFSFKKNCRIQDIVLENIPISIHNSPFNSRPSTDLIMGVRLHN